MDTQEHAIIMPGSVLSYHFTPERTLGSNPTRKLRKRARYPLRHRLSGNIWPIISYLSNTAKLFSSRPIIWNRISRVILEAIRNLVTYKKWIEIKKKNIIHKLDLATNWIGGCGERLLLLTSGLSCDVIGRLNSWLTSAFVNGRLSFRCSGGLNPYTDTYQV